MTHPRSDAAIRQRLASALPVADLEQIAGGSGSVAAPVRPAQLLRPLSNPPSSPRAPRLAPLIIIPDADGQLPDLGEALEKLPRRSFVIDYPPRRHLARLRSVVALAGVLAQAVRDAAPPGPYVIAGVGLGGVVAHEVAVQLQRSGEQVRGGYC